MDKENNIDDLLKLLKDSYGEDAGATEEQSATEGDTGDISSDILQKQLRDRFVNAVDSMENKDSERDEFTYTLDDSFFEEVVEENAEVDAVDEVLELVDTLTAEEEINTEDLSEEIAAEEVLEAEVIGEEGTLEEQIAEEDPIDDEPPFDIADEDDEPPFDVITDEEDYEEDSALELVGDSEEDAELVADEQDTEYSEDERFNYRQESEDSAFSFFGDGFEEEIEEDLEETREDDTVEDEILEDEYEEDGDGVFVEDENGDIVFVDAEGVVLEDNSILEDEVSFEQIEEPEETDEIEEIEEIEENPVEEYADSFEEEPRDVIDDTYENTEIDPIRVPSKFKTLITGYDASDEKYDKYVAPPEALDKEIEETADDISADGVDLGEYFSGSDGQLAMFEDSDADVVDELNYSEDNASEERDAQIALDFDSAEMARINRVISDEPISEIDDGMLALLLEVEGSEVIAGSVSAEKMEHFMSERNKDSDRIDAAEAFAFDGAEYENYEQTEEVLDAYSKEKTFTLMRVIGCGLFTALIVILELLRFIGVEFEGLLDYTVYPFIYSVISVQLLILCALFAWRELLRGFKRAFTYNVSNWSAVSIVFGFTVIYSFICAFMDLEYNSHVFCSISALYILFGLVTEYVCVCRELKSFRIYATDKNKFTFNTDPCTIQSAEKMHRGGVSPKSSIFEPAEIKFPSGYFSAVNSDRVFEKSLRGSVCVIIAISVLVLLANVIMGNSVEASMGMFMIALTALAPISSLAYHTFPMYKLSSKLYTREIAVAGENMAEKYAQCEYIVLSDMHLFKRALPQNNGIFICNDEKTDTIIEYLDALYSAIGGPMKEMFSKGEPSAHTVKLRRIARDGIEAAIDSQHSVLLGNAEFLKRYGVYIGDMRPTKRGEGILGFAIDGMPAAKLCIRYETEPLFEMLAERLAENGIKCAIETYDPVISSKYAADCRDRDAAPVNVIHKNASDYYSTSKVYRKESTGMVVCSSRLKLIEAVIWCKRISRIWKICRVCQYVMYALAFAGAAVVTAFGFGEYVNQYTVLLMQIIAALPTIIAMLSGFPDKDYFSLQTDQSN